MWKHPAAAAVRFSARRGVSWLICRGVREYGISLYLDLIVERGPALDRQAAFPEA